MYISTNKKSYEIAKALEAAKRIQMDLYYIVRYEKKAEQDMLIIDRGVSGYETSTKWNLYIDDNGIKVEKKWTFDQYFYFVFMVIGVLISGVMFITLSLALILSLMRGRTPDISVVSLLCIVISGFVGIIFAVIYKHIYYDRPREILLMYFEKYIVGDVSGDGADESLE